MFSNKGNTAPGLLKFQTPEDPIEQELKKKQWEAPNLIKMEYIDKKLREKEEAIKKAKNMQFEEAAAKLNAIEVYRMQIEMETYDAEVNECFLKDFRDFLQGKSAFNKNPKLVPWKEHPLVGRDIDAYLDAMLDKKLDFDKKIAKMTMFKMAPRNLQDAWMYYVFVVRGKRPPVDLFLKDWDAFYAIPKEFTPPQDGPYEEYKQTPSADLPNLKKPLPGGIVGPQEACKDSKVTFNNAGDIHEVTNAAVQQNTRPSGRPIGHNHPSTANNDNDDQNVAEAMAIDPEAAPPVAIAINPAAPIEREPDDRMNVAAAVNNTTINNIIQMPTEEFVNRFFKIQDERMEKMLNTFQLQNIENAKALYNNIGVVVTDVLQKTTALQNTHMNRLIRNTEAVISRTIQKGLANQSRSLNKLSKAVSETCGLAIESYKNNKREPDSGGPALTQALAQQAQEIGKLNDALNVSQQNNNAMAQHLNALTQLVEQLKATKPELAPVVEAVAANSNAPILVQSENIAQATKLINKEIAPDVIQPETGMSQQMITHRSRSRVLNRQVQLLIEPQKAAPKRKRDDDFTITDVTDEYFQPSVAQQATYQAVNTSAVQLAIEPPPPLPTTQAQQQTFPQQLIKWHTNTATPAIESKQVELFVTAKQATEIQKSIHEINRERLKKMAIEIKSWRAEYHMGKKFQNRHSASSYQISVANAQLHHEERMAKNPDRFAAARAIKVDEFEKRDKVYASVAENSTFTMEPIESSPPFYVTHPKTAEEKAKKKLEKAKRLHQEMKKNFKPIEVQSHKFETPSNSIGKLPAEVPEKFKDVVAPSAPTNESTAEIDKQIEAQTALLGHLMKTIGQSPELSEAYAKLQELTERKKAMA